MKSRWRWALLAFVAIAVAAFFALGPGLGKVLGKIHIYPTLAEANKNVAGVWRKGHAPGWLLAAERFHAWRRG